MCFKRSYDAVAIAVSILVGIGLTVLEFLGLLVTGLLIPLIAIGFGVVCVLALSIVSASVLRQVSTFDRCVCRKGDLLAISAVGLILIAALSVILAAPALAVTLILRFILFTLFVYAAFALTCLLWCLTRQQG